MMPAEFAALLRDLPALDGLSAEAIAELAASGEERHYERDSLLFSEGEVVDRFNLVLGGRLEASHDGKIIGHVERGETFGQLSLMAEIPSVVTLRVLHDARVFSIPRAAFQKALSSSPEFATNIFKGTAARLAAITLKTRNAVPRIVAVYSAPAGVGKTRFAINLAAAMAEENAGATLLLDVATEKKRLLDILGFGPLPLVDLKHIEHRDRNVATEKSRRHEAGFDLLRVAHHPERSGDDQGVPPLLSALSKTYRHIVIDLPPIMDAAIWKFLQHADVRVVLSSHEPMHLSQTANLLGKLPSPVRVCITRTTPEMEDRRDETEALLGCPVDEFLEELPDDDSIAYRLDRNSRYSRAIRRISRGVLDRLVGLALSGGAARGMSHIGVLRVLEEENIEPDIIAGTSIGALIGGIWAAGKNSRALERIARKIRTSEFFSFFDLAFPPSPGLLRGRKIDAFIKNIFGDLRFRDLKIPLRVSATDIDTADEVIFDRGSVAEAVRASIAIPGILRPYIADGRRLVDGAVVSPVPVDSLRERGVSRIIAVNAIPTPESFRSYTHSGAERPKIRRGLFGRVFDFTPSESIPNLLDIIVRSNHFMEAAIAEESCRAATVMIRPWAPELHWMDFDAAPRFIDSGEKAARDALPKIRKTLE